MQKKLVQAQGNWVDGERFWGREGDLVVLERMINEGAHISIVAQRRMGKTSLMRELARRLGDRYICLFLDLQEEAVPADAVAALALAIKSHTPYWHKAQGLFNNVMNAVTGTLEEISVGDIGLKLRAGLDAGNWMEKGDELFRILSRSEKPVLIMIDEIPLMVNRMLRAGEGGITRENIRRVDQFMSWLRKNSSEHQGIIRLMLAGSIGLEPVLHQAGLSAVINNYHSYELRPWDFQTAAGCLNALANNYEVIFIGNVEEVIAEKLGCCIPHHVQLFFSCVYKHCIHRNDMRFGIDDVDDLYERDMLGLRGHADLAHYEERLSMYFSKERMPFVKAILTETALTGTLNTPVLLELREDYASENICSDDELAKIMQILQHDGYLRKKNEGYVFESNLLRDWWKKAFEEFYTRRK